MDDATLAAVERLKLTMDEAKDDPMRPPGADPLLNDFHTVLSALAAAESRAEVLAAECRAWRAWYDGVVPDKHDMIWAGGDDWGEAMNAVAATDAARALEGKP